MQQRGWIGPLVRIALAVLVSGAAVAGSAWATTLSAGTVPTVRRVHARTLATTGTKVSWELTATATDTDADLVGGRVKVMLGAKGSVLTRRIAKVKARSTSARTAAAGAQAAVTSATLAGTALRVVFYANPAPGPLTITFWVTDAAKHASKRATLHLKVKATQTVTIDATTPDVAEPDVAGTITVSRTGGTNVLPLTVSYTVAGTATAGSDYEKLPGTVTIPAGAASAEIAVQPIDDATIEPVESVVVTIAAAQTYLVGTPNAATATITSDDAPASVSIAATDPAAAEPSSPGTFTVSRTGSVTTSLVVSYTVTGTATAGSDYTALSGSVAIPAGLSDTTITVVPVNDTVIETPETVIVTIRASTRYTIDVPSSATVTITDDDSAATVSIAATDPAAAEPSDSGVVTVTRTGATTSALKVAFTLGGTATAGTDYSTQPSTPVTIPAGVASATIKIVPIDDSIVEPAETVVVTLGASADYTIGASNSATVTIADDEPTVTIAATDAAAAEPSDPGTFTVTRTGSTAAALTVFYTVSGTATNGTDYTALAGSVTIPAGQSSVTITVSPIDDLLVEGAETVIVTLTGTSSYSVGTPVAATVTIADND